MTPLHIARLRSTLVGMMVIAAWSVPLILELRSPVKNMHHVYFYSGWVALGLIMLDPLAVKDALAAVVSTIKELAQALLPWKKAP